MSNLLTDKIDHAYMIYVLSNKNISKASSLTKISPVTMKKYVTIKERLDITLFDKLNKKGKGKLQLGFALDLCNYVLNPEVQLLFYPSLIQTPNKERKSKLQEMNMCMICADSTINFEILPCCNNLLCGSCLITIMETTINNISIKSIQCPFCNCDFTHTFIQWFLKYTHKSYESWRSLDVYRKNKKYNETYTNNLYYKYVLTRKMVRRINDYSEDKYYGVCTKCTPVPSKHMNQARMFRNIKITSVEKTCVNDENQIAVLKPEMFLCAPCKRKEEDPNHQIFKKCPHCGIKTVKPDGCNYVICGDHNWCWICNERLERNHNGHNVHYYIGPGSGPFSDKCRESENYDAPKFILHQCSCNSCRNRPPLCRSIDCMNRTNNVYCNSCLNSQ